MGLTYKDYPCYVFEKGWQPQEQGYKYALTGIICDHSASPFQPEEFQAILKDHIRID